MSKVKKSALEEAKSNFDEIKKYATDGAIDELRQEIDQKVDNFLDKVLNEDVEITIKSDDADVENIDLGGENLPKGELEEQVPPLEDPAAPAAPTVPGAEAPPVEAPVEEVPMDEMPPEEEIMVTDETEEDPEISQIAQELSQDIIKLVKKVTGQETGEAEAVDVIDDETAEMPPEGEVAPPAPAEMPPAAPAPVQEDGILEFDMNELYEDEEETMIQFEPNNQEHPEEDEFEFTELELEEMLQKECDTTISEEDEEPLEEMLGNSETVKRTTAYKEPTADYRTSRKNVAENKTAQKESGTGELIKENESLKKSVGELSSIIKEYEEAFTDVRKQFDEMQTFNAKLAWANKIFSESGLTRKQKETIAEKFDQAKNANEAEKVYKEIISEHKITPATNAQPEKKIKASNTKTVSAPQKAQPLYESREMSEIKRNQELAGIKKTNQ